MTRLLKLITFDVTETLMVFQPPVAIKYAETAKNFGIHVDSKDILPNFKVQWKTLSKIHPNFGRDTGLGWEKWWTQIVVNTFKSVEPTSDVKVLQQLAAFLIEEYKTTRCWALADGALDILEFLRTKNIPIGVISNYDERLASTLNSLKIHSYFNFILTSYSAGVMKPERMIFDLARTQNSVKEPVSPECCLHIGNSLEFDYIGSKNAGWKSVYVGPLNEKVLKTANSSDVYQNLTELRNQFEKILISS